MRFLSEILDWMWNLLGYVILFLGLFMLGTFLFIGPLAFTAIFMLKEMYVLSGLSFVWAIGGVAFGCWLLKNPHSQNRKDTDFVYYQ